MSDFKFSPSIPPLQHLVATCSCLIFKSSGLQLIWLLIISIALHGEGSSSPLHCMVKARLSTLNPPLIASCKQIESLKAQLADTSQAKTARMKGRGSYDAESYDDDHDDPYDNAGGTSLAAQLAALQTQLEQLQLENAEMRKQVSSWCT
jgi:hypothetical protein